MKKIFAIILIMLDFGISNIFAMNSAPKAEDCSALIKAIHETLSCSDHEWCNSSLENILKNLLTLSNMPQAIAAGNHIAQQFWNKQLQLLMKKCKHMKHLKLYQLFIKRL